MAEDFLAIQRERRDWGQTPRQVGAPLWLGLGVRWPRVTPSFLFPPNSHPAPIPHRDVSSVELLMKYHQGIWAEMDTRSKNFSACLELGESLLQRQHQASDEVGGTAGQGRGFSCPRLHCRRVPKLPGREPEALRRLIFLSPREHRGCVQVQGLQRHHPV